MAQNVDEMAVVLLEQFERWVSVRPNGKQLLEAMDVVDEAVSSEEILGAEACWVVSQAALRIAVAASEGVDFAPIAVMYQTVARLFGVAAAARRGER